MSAYKYLQKNRLLLEEWQRCVSEAKCKVGCSDCYDTFGLRTLYPANPDPRHIFMQMEEPTEGERLVIEVLLNSFDKDSKTPTTSYIPDLCSIAGYCKKYTAKRTSPVTAELVAKQPECFEVKTEGGLTYTPVSNEQLLEGSESMTVREFVCDFLKITSDARFSLFQTPSGSKDLNIGFFYRATFYTVTIPRE